MSIRHLISVRVLIAACALAALSAGTNATAATFVVTSLADTAGATCAANCTLRQAITAANATAAADTINFAIPSPATGELLIQPATALPTITQPVTIDGYSQPGTAVNTSTTVSDAELRVRIDGVVSRGLAICADDVTIRGLSVTGFAASGLAFGETSGGATCAAPITGGRAIGNFIGLRTNGSTVGANAFGIIANRAVVAIGSEDDADRNVISGNTDLGIRISGQASSGSDIRNNLIGTSSLGAGDRGNGGAGINITGGVEAVEIGTNSARNRIAFNGVGLSIASSVVGPVRHFANEFRRNDDLAIDLGQNGVTPNDANDVDTGVNGLQNFPVILSGARTETGATADMRLDVGHAENRVYRIGLYASPLCDPSGHGEGEFLLSQGLRTISASTETFTVGALSDVPMPPGTVFTATATDTNNNTSEFSECFELDPPSLVVNTVIDVGDGVCDTVACTLREAIDGANARPEGSFSEISFAIPGQGPHLIAPESPLPTLRRSIRIDGYTQPGSSPNTLASGSDAVLQIEIADLVLPRLAGLRVCAPDVTLRGLAISGFDANLRTQTADCVDSPLRLTIEGNFFGLRPDGSASPSANSNIRLAAAATGTRIGGTAPAQRNVIASATVAAGSSAGISVSGATVADVQILGNYIGTDPTGLLPRGNGGGGIEVTSGAQQIVIGGVEPGAANRIAFNEGDGIFVNDSGTAGVTAFGNDIFDNEDGFSGFDLGIRLGTGAGTNDTDDVDAGPNQGQNFPVLLSASEGPSGLTVAGSLDVPAATDGASYTIAVYESSVCDPSGRGEGQIFLGAASVVLSSDAEAFEFILPIPPQFQGEVITSTATDPLGNTSAFSTCLSAPADPLVFADGFED
jgi:CSLREA domain-containing protein